MEPKSIEVCPTGGVLNYCEVWLGVAEKNKICDGIGFGTLCGQIDRGVFSGART